MADRELKTKVVSGVVWSLSEKIGTMLLQMVVSIIVARRLMPEDFGVMAIMTFFTSLALAMVDSGFSQTLIRKSSPTADDYRSVAVFNMFIAVVLYLLLTALSPAIAAFYGHPVIAQIAPVLLLLLPVNALCVVQTVIFTREFRFALMSKVVFFSSLVSGIIAVGMALAGCGVWSLVAQRIAAMAVKAAMFRWLGRRPAGARFSSSALRAMAPYSLRLLATDLITAVYNNISQLIIGKVYSATSLGYFSQAQKLKDLPVTSTVQSVQSVTFPALAKIGGDSGKFAESYRQILSVTAFVVLPAMTGLIAIAPDMFALLLGDKWLPTVPYFEIICIGGMLYPLSVVAYNVLKVRSDGRIILRLEIVKKIIMTLILAYVFLVKRSMESVAWGLTIMSGVEFAINVAVSLRYTTLRAGRIAATLLPTLLATGAMFAAVMAMRTYAAALTLGLRLMICIATGVAVYPIAAAVMRSEALREVLRIVKRMLARNQ